MARRQELGVRLALGASRLSLIRSMVVEASLVAIAGAAFGLSLARVLIVMLGDNVDVGGGSLLHLEPRMDVAVLIGTLAASMLALFVAGVVPATQATRLDLRSTVTTDAPQVAPRWRIRRLLIAGQVAVSILLLAIATLCLNQVRLEAQRDPGIDLERLALAEVDFGAQQYDEPRARHVIESTLARLARGTGVEAASVMSGLPVIVGNMITPGGVVGTHRPDSPVELIAATPAVFATLGVPLLRGRALETTDGWGAESVVVLSESAAGAVFGPRDAIGVRSSFSVGGGPARPTIRSES
jgi:hypothetical protein